MSLQEHLETLLESKGFKKLLAKLYGFGAAIVVLGALFKIEHWPGSSIFLSAGLITESIIFFFYAFDSDEEPDRVYPEIINATEDGNEDNFLPIGQNQSTNFENSNSLALAKLDEMLENAEITPYLLDKFGYGIKKIGETAESMNSMADIPAASISYMKTIRKADESLARLAKSYESTISKVTVKTIFKYKSITNSLSLVEEEARTYSQQLKSLNENLNTLNTIYFLQKKEANSYLKDMTASAAESKKYREQMAELNGNLADLNKFYKKMLTATKDK